MPRDITVILEKKTNGQWCLVLPMVKNNYFNSEDPKQNWINDSMYISEYYPEPIYDNYNPQLCELFGVEGKLSRNTRKLPSDCSSETKEFHTSYGSEAFGEHWIECEDFISKAENHGAEILAAQEIVLKIKEIGDPKKMRLVLWFSQ